MKRFLGRLAILLATVCFLCLVGGGALAKDPSRPFRGHSEGTIVAAAPCAGGEVFSESGNATHLGLYEASGCVFVVGAQSPTVLMVAGGGVVTAANGDEIDIVFSGTTDVGGDPWLADILVSITGGTGRFANASGNFDYLQIRPASGTTYTAVSFGTIAY